MKIIASLFISILTVIFLLCEPKICSSEIIVCKLNGSAQCCNASNGWRSLQVFDKISVKDKIIVDNNSTIKLCFSRSKRCETWEGYTEFVLNENCSQSLMPQKTQMVVSNCKDDLISLQKSLPKLPNIFSKKANYKIENKTLNNKEVEVIEKAKLIYGQSKQLDPNDYTPDIVYYNVLVKYRQHSSVALFLSKLRLRLPSNETLTMLLESMYLWSRSPSQRRCGTEKAYQKRPFKLRLPESLRYPLSLRKMP